MSMLSGDPRSLSYDACTYVYPLVTMEVTRRQMINVAAGTKPGFGPPNEFHHIRAFPPADFRAVVRPNFDTDALGLDHRAHADQRPGRLRRRECRSGRVHDQAAHLRFVVDPGVEMAIEPLRQVNGTSAVEFFTYACDALKVNAPHATDLSILARIGQATKPTSAMSTRSPSDQLPPVR